MGEKDRMEDGEMRLDKATSRPACAADNAEGGLPSPLQGAIGKQLRHVYGQMLSEPLPDKFTDLLAALGKSGSKE